MTRKLKICLVIRLFISMRNQHVMTISHPSSTSLLSSDAEHLNWPVNSWTSTSVFNMRNNNHAAWATRLTAWCTETEQQLRRVSQPSLDDRDTRVNCSLQRRKYSRVLSCGGLDSETEASRGLLDQWCELHLLRHRLAWRSKHGYVDSNIPLSPTPTSNKPVFLSSLV